LNNNTFIEKSAGESKGVRPKDNFPKRPNQNSDTPGGASEYEYKTKQRMRSPPRVIKVAIDIDKSSKKPISTIPDK
jgi:hypothetical protein